MPINSYRMLTSKQWPRIPQLLESVAIVVYGCSWERRCLGGTGIPAALAGGMPALPGFLLFGE
jgi:hypothetical protein